MATKIAELFVKVGADVAEFRKGMDDSASRLRDLSATSAKSVEGFDKLSKGMLAAGGTIAVGLGASVKTAMDFEAQMSKVQALSGATKGEFDSLRKSAIELGAASTFSASEAAEGMQNLAAAGFKTKEVLAAMPGVLNAAAASGESFANVSDIMITAMNGFKLKAGDMGHIADVLAGAANDSSISIGQIGLSLKYVAPVAAASGQSLESVAAALAVLGNAGIKADSAGTALRQTFARLADPPKEAAAELAKLGISVTDAAGKMLPLGNVLDQFHNKFATLNQAQRLQAASTVFGTEAMSSAIVLIEKGGAAIDQLSEKYRTNTDVAKKAAEIMTNNLKGAMSQLSGAFESASISIGSALIPQIRALAEGIAGLVNRFNALPESTKQFIAIGAAVTSAVLLIGGALAGVVAIIPSFIAGWGAVVAAVGLIATPVGIAVAAIAAVSVAAAALWKDNETLRSELTNAWSEVKAAAVDVWPWVSELFKGTAGTLKSLMPVVSAVVVAGFQTIANIVTTTLGVVKGVVGTVVSILSGDFSGAWQKAKNTVTTVIGGIVKQAEILGTGILQIVSNIVKGVDSWLGAKLESVLRKVAAPIEAAKKAFFGLYDAVVGHSYIPDMVDEVGQHMGRLTTTLVKPAQTHTKSAEAAFAKMQKEVNAVMASFTAKMGEAALEFRVTGDASRYLTDKIGATNEALRGLFAKGLTEANVAVQGMRDRLRELIVEQQRAATLAANTAPFDTWANSLRAVEIQEQLWGASMATTQEKIRASETAITALAERFGPFSDEVTLAKEKWQEFQDVLFQQQIDQAIGEGLGKVEKQLAPVTAAVTETKKSFMELSKEQIEGFKGAQAVIQTWEPVVKQAMTSGAQMVRLFGVELEKMDAQTRLIAQSSGNAIEALASTATKAIGALASGNELGALAAFIEGAIKLVSIGLEAFIGVAKEVMRWYVAIHNTIATLTGSSEAYLVMAEDVEKAYKTTTEAVVKGMAAAEKAVEEKTRRITEAARTMIGNLGSSIGDVLSGKLDLSGFEKAFTQGMRNAVVNAIQKAMVDNYLMKQLQPTLELFTALLDAGDFSGAEKMLQSVAGQAKAAAENLAPMLKSASSAITGAFGGGEAATSSSGKALSLTYDYGGGGSYTQASLEAAIKAGSGTAYDYYKSLGLIPFATGGIVTGPTPALIGEAGPEAVIPLDRLGKMGGDTYITIEVSGNTLLNDQDGYRLAEVITRAMQGRGGFQFT